MEEEKFRSKVTLMSFICCVLVIWHHSGNADLFAGAEGMSGMLDFFENRLTFAVIRADIPAFFMLSGYLFFRNFTWQSLPGKWKRRVRSLVIPYLLWNLIYYLARLVLSRMGTAAYLAGQGAVPVNLPTILRAVFLFQYNPVFWFMYQLILLVILAPAIRFFLSTWWSSVLYAAFLIYVFITWPVLPLVNQDALIYYSIGAFWAVWGKSFAEKPRSGKRILAGVLGVLFFVFFYLGQVKTGSVQLLVASLAILPQAVWLLLPEDIGTLIRKSPWMRCTFFIYAVHFVIVRAANKAGAVIFPGSTAAGFLLYIFMPVPVVFLCWQMAKILRRFCPRIWVVLNGGR